MQIKHTAIFIFTVLFNSVCFSQSKVSLQDAIQLALQNNPRTKANAMRIEAALEQTKAFKQSALLPSVSSLYSQDLNKSYSQDLDVRRNKLASLSLNLNLFNGFSDYYQIKAQDCEYKKLVASYKSTNAFLQNTSGQIVGLVVDSYVSLVNNRADIDFNTKNVEFLNSILPYALNAEQKSLISEMINSAKIYVLESESNLKNSEANYKFIVNVDTPSSTDNLTEIISKIVIPSNSAESFEISLLKSPEILGAKLSLECQKLSYKSEKAQLYGPRVDFSVSRSTDFQGNRSTGAQIVISKSFDLGRFTANTASSKNLLATQLELDGTIAEVQNKLFNSHNRLISAEKTLSAYIKNYTEASMIIKSILANIKNITTEEMNILINLVGLQSSQLQIINSKKQEMVNIKYSIQREIGTLFEINNLSLQQ